MSKPKARRQGRLAKRRADRYTHGIVRTDTDDPEHGPIEASVRSEMQEIAQLIDQAINYGPTRRHGFVLTTFRFGSGRHNYISNCKDRTGVAKALRELADQLERTARWDGEQQSVTEQ